jgi:site-specific recombinase XerD
MDIKKIQYLAGHSNVQMTLNIYSHVTENTPDQMGDLINGVFSSGQISGQTGNGKSANG